MGLRFDVAGGMQFVRHSVLAMALCSLTFAAQAQATQYPTAAAAFEGLGDYSTEDGTLAVESTKPLRIRISPTVVPGDLPKVVQAETRRAAVYAVLRVFAHTNATQVQVTSIPRSLNLKTGNGELLKAPRASVSVDRATVDALVRSELKVSGFNGLVGGQLPDSWSPAAKRAMYSDGGPPGVERFSQLLGMQFQAK